MDLQEPKLIQKCVAAASLLLSGFSPEDLLKLVWVYERSGVTDEAWERAAASQQISPYDFPRIGLEVMLRTQVPSSLTRAEGDSLRSPVKSNSTIGGRFRSGMVAFDAS